MMQRDVIRVATVLLLGVGGGVVRGGEIPVHRDYTRPIQLYDDRGGRSHYDGEAPDRMAWQQLRDTRAQEGMMGRETLLDLGFRSGESVFGWTSRSSGGMSVPLPARAEEDRRTRGSDGDRNWLVQSLSLPTLGGGSSNAAVAATSGGRTGSNWGWLADEVQGGDRETGRTPAEEAMLAEEETWRPEGRNPYAMESEGRGAEALPGARRPAAARGTLSSAGEREMEYGREPAVPVAGREDLWPAGDIRAEAASPALVLPELSKTREMLGGVFGAAGPDRGGRTGAAETWSSGLPPAGIGSGGTPAGMASPPRSYSDFGGRDSGITLDFSGALRGGEAIPAMGQTGFGDPKPMPSSWQGGWKAQPIRESGMGAYSLSVQPVPLPRVEPATRPPPVLPAGGGMKPGWY